MAPRPSSRTILYRPIRSIQFRNSTWGERSLPDGRGSDGAEAPRKPDRLLTRPISMSKGSIRRALSCALFFFVVCTYPGFGQQARKRQVKHAAPQFVPNRYIVFLQDPPVSARYTERERMQTTEALAYQRQIVTRQQSLMTDLTSRNIRVTGSVNK